MTLTPELPPGDFSNPPAPDLGSAQPEFTKPAPVERPPRDSPKGPVGQEPATGAVELVAERTEFLKVWANPDGTNTAQLFANPVHYKGAGDDWIELDNSLLPSLAGRLENAAGPFVASFAALTLDQELVSVTAGSHEISLSAPWVSSVAGVPSGASILYPDAAPDVDLEYEVTANGVKENIILESALAPVSYSFLLSLSTGLEPVPTETGSIEVRDVGGEVVYTLPAPMAYDSALEPLTVAGLFSLNKAEAAWELDVSLPAEWLADTSRVFPVILDPTLTIGRGSADTDSYVKSGFPDSHFTSSDIGGVPPYNLLLGYFDSDHQFAEGFQKFPEMSWFVGHSIQSAAWWGYFTQQVGMSALGNVGLSPVTMDSSWSPLGLTWNSSASFPSRIAFERTLNQGSGPWFGAEVGDWAWAWASGEVDIGDFGSPAEAGFYLTTPFVSGSSPQYVRLAAVENGFSDTYDSHINVTYTVAPNATLISPANGSTTATLTPTLTATISDPEGQALDYYFQVCTDLARTNCFDSSPVTGVTSGSTANFTVPSGLLAYSSTYYWFVRVGDDGYGWWTRIGSQFHTPADPTLPAPPPSHPVSPAQDGIVASTGPALTSQAVTSPHGTVEYWFRLATGTDGVSGQTLNSGWLASPSWTVPAGFLQDGLAYTWRVYTRTPGSYQAVGNVGAFSVNLRIGNQAGIPYSTFGPVSVNLFNGNLIVNTSSPTFGTVGGDVGLSYQYNSLAPAPAGLRATYFYDTDGGRDFDAGESLLVRRDANVNFNWGSGGPDPAVQAPGSPTPATDQYLVRWEGFVAVPQAGGSPQSVSYEFGADLATNDTVRIWVNTPTGNPSQLDNWSAPATEATTLWGNAVTVTEAQPVTVTVEWADGNGDGRVLLRARKVGQPEVEVPASWLTASLSELSPGWSLQAGLAASPQYLYTRSSAGSVTLVDVTGASHTYKKTTGNGFAPPNGETGLLAYDNLGRLTLAGDDGFSYVFDASGNVISVTSSVDDRRPAAPQYSWSGSPPRLRTINDPVSGRVINLRYQGLDTCPAAPSGFDAAAPQNVLCEVSYWDGTTTKFFYVNRNLGRIEDPGGEVTDFAYDSSGLLSKIRDPLLADTVAAGLAPNDDTTGTLIAYNSGKVSSVTLPAPANGALRPTQTYSYGAQTTIDTLGEGAGDRLVSFDSAGRVTIDQDASGIDTNFEWRTDDRLKWSKDSAGRLTTFLYDHRKRLIDTYGPAAEVAACFSTAVLTPGSACINAIPHRSTTYDGGIVGLAATYFANVNLAGAPALHKTGVGDGSGALNRDWGAGSPDSVLPTSGWSGRFSGDLNVASAGSQTFHVESDDGARLFVDDVLVADNWGSTSGVAVGTVSNLTVGKHRIRVEFADDSDSTAYLRLKWGTTPVLIPGPDLSPAYGLVTNTKVFDSTSGSPSEEANITFAVPELGLATNTVEDPAGLALSTQASFEGDASGYYRRLTRTLPAGNAWSYSYFGATETVDDPCTGPVEAINQGGLLKQLTGPDPDAGGSETAQTDEFRYDSRGRIVASRVNGGGWICTSFDARGRIVSSTIPAFGAEAARTTTYNWAVGNNPLLTSITDPAGTITTQTDRLGRTSTYTDVWGNATAYTYDQAQRLTQTSGPQGAVAYTYDSAGRITNQKLDSLTVAVPTYNSTSGELTSVSYPTGAGNGGNGTVLTIGRDSSGRLTTTEWRTSGGALIASDQVTRSQAGRVVNQLIDGVDPDPAANNFSYDGVGRLTSAKVPGHTLTYGFAPTGGCGVLATAGRNTNRTTVTDNGTTHTYCYNQADRLTSSTDPRVGTLSYDARGNTSSLGGGTLGYDGANLHSRTTQGGATVVYTRDGTGRIVAQSEGSGSGGGTDGFVTLPGLAGSFITAPDHARLDISSDIDLRADLALDDWQVNNGKFVSKLGGAYEFMLNGTSGGLRLAWRNPSNTLLTRNSTAALPVADGARLQVRATLDVDNGASGHTVTFYYRTDTTLSLSDHTGWTQLGSPVTNTGTTAIKVDNTQLSLGASVSGTSSFWAGDYYGALILAGIAGTTAANPDFRTTTQLVSTPPDYSDWQDSPGNPFSLQGSAGYTPGGGGGIGNQPPHAHATATPTSGTAPLLVNFSGTGSTDPESGTLIYAWDLDGDGQWDDSTSSTPSHTFTTSGQKTVSLRVTDPGGLTDTDEVVVTVGSGGGTDGFVTLPGLAGSFITAPDHARLDISSDIDLRADLALDDWQVNNGKFVSKLGGAYEFMLNGTSGGLRLAWRNPSNTLLTRNSTAALPVADGARLQVRATLDVDNGASGHTVTFYYRTDTTLSLSDHTGWTQLGSPVTNTGTTAIKVDNTQLSLGASVSGTSSFWAGDYYGALILAGIAGTTAANPDFRTTTQLVSTPPDYSDWQDSPGNPFSLQGSAGYTPGGGGGIGNQPPHAHATATPTSGTAPLLVNFSGTGSTDPESGTLIYAWDLDGDGQWDDSTSSTPSHTFTTSGQKTVSLRVTDPGGLTDTDEVIVTVGSGGTSTTSRYGYVGPGDGAALVLSNTGAVLGRILVLPGGVLVEKNVGGDSWSAPNVHGDVMAVTNSTGIKQGGTFTYDPHGQPLAGVPNNTEGGMGYGWVGQHLRPTETATTLGYIEMGVRVYVPFLGRFLQEDPIEGGSANWYEYCGGDPVNCWDLTGEWGWREFLETAATVAGGVALGVCIVGTAGLCGAAVGVAVGYAFVNRGAREIAANGLTPAGVGRILGGTAIDVALARFGGTSAGLTIRGAHNSSRIALGYAAHMTNRGLQASRGIRIVRQTSAWSLAQYRPWNGILRG